MQQRKTIVIIFIIISVIITTIYLMIDLRLKTVCEIQSDVSNWIEIRNSYFGVNNKELQMAEFILSDKTQELTLRTEVASHNINSGIIGQIQILQYCSEITASQAAALKEVRGLFEEYGESAYRQFLFNDSTNVLLMISSAQNIRGTIFLHFINVLVWIGLVFVYICGKKKYTILKFVYILVYAISFFITNAKFWYVNDETVQILLKPLLFVGSYEFWRLVFFPCLTTGLTLAYLIKVVFYDDEKKRGIVWLLVGCIVLVIISPVGTGILNVLEGTVVLPNKVIELYFSQSRIIAAAEILRNIFLLIAWLKTQTQESCFEKTVRNTEPFGDESHLEPFGDVHFMAQ